MFGRHRAKVSRDRRLHIAGTGEDGIWVSDYNGILECGDYITTSPIAGIGMKQDNDLVHNYTVGKITMDCDFNPQLVKVQVLSSSNYTVQTSNLELGTSNIESGNPHIPPTSIQTSNITYGTSNAVHYFKDDNGNYIYTDLIIDGNIVYEPEYEVRDICCSITSNMYKMAFVGCVYNSS